MLECRKTRDGERIRKRERMKVKENKIQRQEQERK
jgi:hypothetical protein